MCHSSNSVLVRLAQASAEESFVAFGPEARSSSNRSSENVQSLECGCGHWQPKIVRSGIKVVAKWPEPPAANRGGANKEAAEEDDDDPDDDVDDKQPPAKRKKTAAAKSKRKPKKDDKTAADKDAEEPNNASALTTDEAPLNVSTHPPGGTTRDIPPEEVYAILQRISDYDIHLLGFDPLYGHPSWFVLSALLVPPPCTRPSIPTPHGKKSMAQDHLTFGLLQIVKMNNMLERQLTHDLSACVSHFKALLQYRVSTYLDNESKFVPKATLDSGRPLMSISQRFKTKKGRVRGNLMGKRVDFSARSVITPDANIALNELGVPFSVAMTTTYPERVYERNLAKMQRCVDLGPDEQYGAKFVIDEQGRSIDLRFKRDVQLQNGFIVERHLRDGDLVAFNRQPSLHKFSIQSHYVRLMPGSTFRLNLSATTPYNADFDGDEMVCFCFFLFFFVFFALAQTLD
jgi:DNA-directed RNA polymerase beta' subunit